ncbi:potassium voltage-gated channel protein egl-36-like [Mercenaria mercenaria]|uniref:potassium voltage-gated channel protein egl-36-like n=1 Tax=Mercenaria mercenaria TaxID=6596 RepID=UPI00234EFFE6|nr:potassium voltage-gated channel protein egl-36-like [Mercenaria mercenaria]
MDNKVVTIDIGGKIFKVRKSTVDRIEGTKLSKLGTSIETHSFERDPQLFRHILNAYRYGLVHVPRDVCPVVFKEELLFWNIPLTLVAPCCWKYLYEVDNDVETVKILIKNKNKFENNEDTDKVQDSIERTVFGAEHSENKTEKPSEVKGEGKSGHADKQNTLWLLLDEPGSSAAAKIWCFFYIAVVIVSVIVYIIWLDPRVRVSQYLSKNPDGIDIFANETLYEYLIYFYPEKGVLMVFSDPHPALFAVDMFCVVFFITETILHFSACQNKLTYFKNVYHVSKIVLCVAMIISTAFEMRKDLFYEEEYGYLYYICKSIYVIRLLLIFRLHKIYNRLHIMLLSLTYSCKELGLLLFSFLIAVVVYGCLIFSAEINSSMFENTYISMWWSLITMTTIGYGDFYPTTSFGYVVGVICAVNGIVVLALPIAAIAGTFSNLFSRNADFQKHKIASRKQNQSNGDKNNCFTKVNNTCMKKEKIVVCTPDRDESGDVIDAERNVKTEISDLPTIHC